MCFHLMCIAGKWKQSHKDGIIDSRAQFFKAYTYPMRQVYCQSHMTGSHRREVISNKNDSPLSLRNQMKSNRKHLKAPCFLKGTGTQDLIWLKVVSLDRSWLVGLTDDIYKFLKCCFIFLIIF